MWLSQHSFSAVTPYLSRGIIAGASVPLSCPALQQELAEQRLVDPSVTRATCVGFPQPPSSASVSWTCVHLAKFPRSTLTPIVSVCALISASRARALRHRATVALFGSLCLPSVLRVYVHLLPHCVTWRLFAFLSAVLEGLCAQVWPPSMAQARTLRRLCLSQSHSAPGPALCAARVVCTGWVCALTSVL